MRWPPPRMTRARRWLNAGQILTPERAAAGLWTTPSDLARVVLAVQRAAGGETKLLPAALTRDMLTKQRGDYGLGWEPKAAGHNASFGHSGVDRGFRCSLNAYVSGGQGVMIMTNGDRGSAVASEIGRAVATAYNWPDLKIQRKVVARLSAEQLRAFTGTYYANGATVKFDATDRGLRAHSPMGPINLLPEGPTASSLPKAVCPHLPFSATVQAL